jgi:hypothetical protein
LVTLLAILAHGAIAHLLIAQAPLLTPRGLAAAWTGVRTPTCHAERRDWTTPPGAEHCIWRGKTAATYEAAEVFGTRLADGRYVHVVWARITRDSVAALAVRDSVNAAMLALGVTIHECKWGTRLWLAPDFAAFFGIGVVDPVTGGRRMTIQVLDDPSTVPAFLCPDVRLPPRGGPTRRRTDA